ncbi:hypothetical protein D3C71_833940 [compost metagenome]
MHARGGKHRLTGAGIAHACRTGGDTAIGNQGRPHDALQAFFVKDALHVGLQLCVGICSHAGRHQQGHPEQDAEEPLQDSHCAAS